MIQITYPAAADGKVKEILRSLNMHPSNRISTAGTINVTDTSDAVFLMGRLKQAGVFSSYASLSYPPLAITSLSPSSIAHQANPPSGSTFTVTVTGQGFQAGAGAGGNFAGTYVPAQPSSGTTVALNVPKKLATSGYTTQVFVQNPIGISNSLTFVVT